MDIRVLCARPENQIDGLAYITRNLKMDGEFADRQCQIRSLGFEYYVSGGVAKEIGWDAPPEAKKVQAVIYRTFARRLILYPKYPGEGFDLTDLSDHDQAFYIPWIKYGIEATDAARGKVYFKNGKIGYGYYRSDTDKEGYISQRRVIEKANKGWDYIRILKSECGEDIEIINIPIQDLIYIPQGNYNGDNYEISSIKYQSADDKPEEKNTIGKAGCAIMCLYLVLLMLGAYGFDLTYADHVKNIKELAKFSLDNKCKTDGGTSIKKLCSMFVPTKNIASSYTENEDEAIRWLENGIPFLASVGPENGTFTDGNHIVFATQIITDEFGGKKLKIISTNEKGNDRHKANDEWYTLEQFQAASNNRFVIIGKGDNMFETLTIKTRKSRYEDTKKVQLKLIELGLLSDEKKNGEYGQADGDYYTKTAGAVSEYQYRHGMVQTGEVNEELYNELTQPEIPAAGDIDLQAILDSLNTIEAQVLSIRAQLTK